MHPVCRALTGRCVAALTGRRASRLQGLDRETCVPSAEGGPDRETCVPSAAGGPDSALSAVSAVGR